MNLIERYNMYVPTYKDSFLVRIKNDVKYINAWWSEEKNKVYVCTEGSKNNYLLQDKMYVNYNNKRYIRKEDCIIIKRTIHKPVNWDY